MCTYVGSRPPYVYTAAAPQRYRHPAPPLTLAKVALLSTMAGRSVCPNCPLPSDPMEKNQSVSQSKPAGRNWRRASTQREGPPGATATRHTNKTRASPRQRHCHCHWTSGSHQRKQHYQSIYTKHLTKSLCTYQHATKGRVVHVCSGDIFRNDQQLQVVSPDAYTLHQLLCCLRRRR